jgi:uncharacterized protein YecT (DUF1311 family)
MDVAVHYAADPVAASKLGARASFDCAKAQTPLEKAICSDIGLGHADIVLSRVYSGLLRNSNETDKAGLIQSERQWLRSVPAKCGLVAPPFSTKSLDCARNQFEFRFTALDSCQESIADCLRDVDAPARPHHRSQLPVPASTVMLRRALWKLQFAPMPSLGSWTFS